MRHVPITCEQRDAMLRVVGAGSAADLFVDVPESVLLDRPLDLPAGMSEIELSAHLRELADKNAPAAALVSFAGAGCYDHYVPSVVDHVLRRPEFFTAYTPYQPEVSQGTLQAIYEFQSMVCALTGMDVANASMYDGATAFTEAALMACRVTKRRRVIVAGPVHAEWDETLATYAESGVITVDHVDDGSPVCPVDDLRAALSGDVAAVLVTSPNFLGHFEDIEAMGTAAHEAGALLVVGVNPILLGLCEPPSAAGADIVVGEGQPLGSPMSFGGPGLGFFACRSERVRQMPGRVVGRTVDVDGNAAFVLTLSTREQHIRREKATSNICSNHSLNALAAAVYLSAVGANGLRAIAASCVTKAHYLREGLLATGRFEELWDLPFGYEFALRYVGDEQAMYDTLVDRGYIPGVLIDAADGGEIVLFAVTEKRTRSEIDAFIEAVAAL